MKNQPTAKISNEMLSRIILREFGERADEITQKLNQVKSDSQEGKNRIAAAILKLSNRDIKLVQHYIEKSNVDFRDIIAEAEYRKCSTLSFEEIETNDMDDIYLEDWNEYSKWLERK